jgi:hypothetical protein
LALGAVLLVLALFSSAMLAWGLWVAAQQGWHQGWNGGIWHGFVIGWQKLWAEASFGGWPLALQQPVQTLQQMWVSWTEGLNSQPGFVAMGLDGELGWLWAALAVVALVLLAGAGLWALCWLVLGLVVLPLLLVVGVFAAAVVVLLALAAVVVLPLLAVAALLWWLLRRPQAPKTAQTVHGAKGVA